MATFQTHKRLFPGKQALTGKKTLLLCIYLKEKLKTPGDGVESVCSYYKAKGNYGT